MSQLSLLACVDYLEYFQIVYILHSLDPDRTAVIKTDVPYETAALPSVTSVWRAADWYEREAHDLFGVHFEGHPDLSPLLLYEGFEGYPGRKEYPFNDYQEF
jgi:NADH-quinone oxidoreductase subunit C